ncbi:hypothetical protein HDV00_007124 [Rhizophlyctis rosea]|nr:hypothetical protein HDV00_007124 [Rhizophlyctis rosea]
MSSVLIIGATRGLGASLTKLYAAQSKLSVVATTRSASAPEGFSSKIRWLTGIDLEKECAADDLVKQLEEKNVGPIDTVIITAGYFATETFAADSSGPSWSAQQKTYTTSSIAPVFLVHRLVHFNFLPPHSKVVLVSSEAGSIALRHEKEGGGNYAHHASKAALNMVGKLLSLDVRERGVVVSIVHPGFMRTEMTRGVGYDKYWDAGGAVTPDEAAVSLKDWAEKLSIDKTGEYWAIRGPRDIGTAEVVLGKDLPTPLQLPW